MNAKKMILTVLAVLGAIAIVVIGIVSNSGANENPEANSTPSASSSSSATSVPLTEESFVPEPSATSSASSAATAKPTPKPSPTASSVPAVAPSLKPIVIDGFGDSPELEKDLSKEEIQARETMFKVIPAVANQAASQFKSPLNTRDQLLKAGLITSSMAEKNFASKFTPFESTINKTGYTVQTSGLKCVMRTLTPQTALEIGKVTCYFTRGYVDGKGYSVGKNDYEEKTGGIGSIDPDQISRVEVSVKKEGNAWKVDDLRFN